MSTDAAIQKDADLAHQLLNQLGDVIAHLVNKHGCQVSMEVYFNEGSESMLHYQLSGEFAMTIAKVEEIEPSFSAPPPSSEG